MVENNFVTKCCTESGTWTDSLVKRPKLGTFDMRFGVGNVRSL
jgi:hypothetical protein